MMEMGKIRLQDVNGNANTAANPEEYMTQQLSFVTNQDTLLEILRAIAAAEINIQGQIFLRDPHQRSRIIVRMTVNKTCEAVKVVQRYLGCNAVEINDVFRIPAQPIPGQLSSILNSLVTRTHRLESVYIDEDGDSVVELSGR